MLAQFSPLSRKVLAIGLLLLLLLIVWSAIIAPLASAINTNLTELEDARYQRMRLEALDRRPSPETAIDISAETVIEVESAEQANEQFITYFSGLATNNGLQVTRVSPRVSKGTKNLLGLDFELSGEEEKISRFINIAERSFPMVRFKTWKIEASGQADSDYLFVGQAIASWRQK